MRGWYFLSTVLGTFPLAHGDQHELKTRQNGGGNSIPIQIANWCSTDIWPGILTQGGDGPGTGGFHLSPGSNQSFSVSSNWQGRIWGRTNCSFGNGGGGSACSTGDCAGALSCQIAGQPPATLGEFTLQGSDSQTFYDLSLVDGYNIPVAIVLLSNGNSQLQSLAGNKTNPSCVASVGDFAAQSNFDPYTGGQQFLGTSASDPLQFETANSYSAVADWCPWDLQVNTPKAPGNGVYPYPDGNVQRPPFDPCYSACAKYNSDQYCCTGSYDGPGLCQPNYYSKAAKSMCPDAYSYAYDDASSTFVVPQGGGFQVIFCPGGRSTNILGLDTNSGSSSSGSRDALVRVGWLLIDARLLKVGLAWVSVAVLLS